MKTKLICAICALCGGMATVAKTVDWTFVIPDAPRGLAPVAPETMRFNTTYGSMYFYEPFTTLGYVYVDGLGGVWDIQSTVSANFARTLDKISDSQGSIQAVAYMKNGGSWDQDDCEFLVMRGDTTSKYVAEVQFFGNPFAFEDNSGVGFGTGGSENVPEPTSGAMVLLGMAGMCLRRKRG